MDKQGDNMNSPDFSGNMKDAIKVKNKYFDRVQDDLDRNDAFYNKKAGINPSASKIRKPPLGVIPKHIWEQEKNKERKYNLLLAISKRLEENFPIPPEWVKEWNDSLEY